MKRFFVGLLTIAFLFCLFVAPSFSAFSPSPPVWVETGMIETLVTADRDCARMYLDSTQEPICIENTLPDAFFSENRPGPVLTNKPRIHAGLANLSSEISDTKAYNGRHLIQRE